MKHRNAKLALIATLVLAPALSAASRAGEGVDLRLKLQPGQVLRYESSSQQDMDIDMDGQKVTMKNRQEGVSAFKVVSVDDRGNFRMELTGERLKMSMQSPAMSMEYDSTKLDDQEKQKEKSLLGKFTALMATARFTATLSPSGQVVESSGMAELQKQLLEAFPEAAGQIKMMTGKETEEALWAAFCQRPQEHKTPGDTWVTEKNAMGMMQMKMTSRLEKVVDGQPVVVPAGLEIAFGDFAKKGDPANPFAALAKNMKATKTELTGSTTLDAASGVVRQSDSKMVLDYGLTVPGSDKAVSYHIVQTATSRLLPAAGTGPQSRK